MTGNWGTDTIEFTIPAFASKQFNSNDLESGNASKDMLNGIGDGQGAWRLFIDADSSVDVMAYMRTSEGFLNDLHDVTGGQPYQYAHDIPIFNPASNNNQLACCASATTVTSRML